MTPGLIERLEAAGEHTPSPAEVVAELRSAAIAIRLFGLDRLPEVLNQPVRDAEALSRTKANRRGGM